MRLFCLGLMLFLAACSSTSKICNKDGICLYVWRSSGFTSSVTIAQLHTKNGTPIVGTTIAAIGNGSISDIDPLASDLNTTAVETKTATGF